MAFARNTTVEIERTQAELKVAVVKYGATAFVIGEEIHSGDSFVEFVMANRRIRFIVQMPERSEFAKTPAGQRRQADKQESAWEQACRQRWRALLLVVRARLEAVESGIETIERAFLADIVLPDNRRVAEWIGPELERSYATGQVTRALLPGVET